MPYHATRTPAHAAFCQLSGGVEAHSLSVLLSTGKPAVAEAAVP